jgi:hypothetical protein
MARRRSKRQAARLGIGAALGAIALATLLFGGLSPSLLVRPGGPPSAPPAATFQGFAAVEIVPAAATVADGANASFALWVGSAAPGCAVETPVVVWELATTEVPLGALLAPSGTSVEFTAFPGASGTIELSASVEGTIYCSTNNASFGTEAYAQVSTVPSLALSGWTAGVAPVAPGSPVTCRGNLTGGEAPYAVNIEFGDGNATSLNVARAGPFSVSHLYGLGSYLPSVTVTDPLGERVEESADSPVLVAQSLAAQEVPTAAGAEEGVPFPLAALVEGGFPPYSYLWNDSAGDAGTGASWTVPPSSESKLVVGLEVSDRLGDSIQVERAFSVANPVTVRALPETAGGDVGRPVPLTISVTGGVGPFTVSGSSLPSGSSFSFTVPTFGNWSEALVPTLAAPLWASLSVTDALGVSDSLTVPLATVHSSPFLLANLTPSLSEVGGSIAVVGLSGGGTPPLNWSIATTAQVSSPTPRFGTVSTAGLFSWQGTLTAAGSGLFLVTLVDGSGATVSANLSLRVLDPLSSSLLVATGAPAAGEPLPLSLALQGGAPPYRYSLSLSDGEAFEGNLSLPGPAQWSAEPRAAGYLVVHLVVVDSLGFRAESNLTVAVAPGVGTDPNVPRGGGANGSATVAASGGTSWIPWVSLPVALLIGLLWFLRGRLTPRAPSAAPEPTGALPTVRRLLRESEGLDEESLLLLAEEEGIEPESARRALKRWVALGRAESVEEGEEPALYRWNSAPSREHVPGRSSGDGREELR